MPELASPYVEDVHIGLAAHLRADPALTQLAPAGVWSRRIPQQVRIAEQTPPVAVVTRVQDGHRLQTQDRAGYEVIRYSVMAVAQSATGAATAAAVAAAKRVTRALEGQSFPVVGYGVIGCEIDEAFGPQEESLWDGSFWWESVGRIWAITVAPLVD